GSAGHIRTSGRRRGTHDPRGPRGGGESGRNGEEGRQSGVNRPGFVRDLEAIEERDSERRSSRLGTLVLVSLAGGCATFALMAHLHRSAPSATQPPDPLGDLLAKAKVTGASNATLAETDVKFPALLSDAPQTTTALAAVRAGAAAPAVTAVA